MDEIRPITAKLPVRKVVRKEANSKKKDEGDFQQKSDDSKKRALETESIIDEYA